MDWLEVSVSTHSLASDLVSEALMSWGAQGTQIIDRADVPDPARPQGFWELIDPEMLNTMPLEVQVKAWFPEGVDLLPLREALEALPARAGFALGTLAVQVHSVAQQDWAEHWKRYYKPLRVGKRLVIRPSWEPYAPQPQDLVIDLDPGMAFGTGTHESTALCMELLERHATSGRVLDVGTGSGILALAAARLGAREVLAIDIDPVAVKAAGKNVAANGLAGRITVRQGDLITAVEGRWDLGCANILADVIIGLAPDMLRVLRPGAVFICSGIIRERARDVMEALCALGYQQLEQRTRGEWAAFAFLAPEG